MDDPSLLNIQPVARPSPAGPREGAWYDGLGSRTGFVMQQSFEAGLLIVKLHDGSSPEDVRESIEKIAELESAIDRARPGGKVGDGINRINEAEGALGKLGAMWDNPEAALTRVFSNVAYYSPLMVASLVSLPAGTAATGYIEAGYGFLSALRGMGVDTRDSDAFESALQDEDVVRQATLKAGISGTVWSAVNVASFGLAGPVTRMGGKVMDAVGDTIASIGRQGLSASFLAQASGFAARQAAYAAAGVASTYAAETTTGQIAHPRGIRAETRENPLSTAIEGTVAGTLSKMEDNNRVSPLKLANPSLTPMGS